MSSVITPSKNIRSQRSGLISLSASHIDPLHRQLRDQLRSKIAVEYEHGDIFYSEHDIVRELSVSRVTARRALDDLSREGLLSRQVGRGTIVTKINTSEPAPPKVEYSSRQTSQLRSIGLIVTGFQADYVNALIDTLCETCASHDLKHPIVSTNLDENIDQAMEQISSSPDEQAYVTLLTSNSTLDIHNRLSLRGYRAIAVDGLPGGFHGPAVTTDSRGVIRIGLDHLWSLGHERIALLVNEPMSDASVIDKVDEFSIAMRERGVPDAARLVLCGTRYGESSYDAAYKHMDEIWNDRPQQRPTAIFTVSDPGAWAALKWLSEQGVDIPGDVSVIGFEDARTSAHVTPPLTTVAHPLQDIASRIVALLVSGQSLAGLREYVRPYLVVRQSTGPARLS